MERTQVHIVGDRADLDGVDDLAFAVVVPPDAVVRDADAALWAYSQYGATVVAALGGAGDDAPVILAGPAWALRAALDGSEAVDAELDEAGLLGTWIGPASEVGLHGLHVDVDRARPAIVVVPSERRAALVDELAEARRRHGNALDMAFRSVDGAPKVVAPEILELPLLDPDGCAALVALATDTDAWGSDPDDPVPGEEVSLARLSPQLYARLEDHLDTVVVPALRAHWPEIAWNGLHDAFVIRYRSLDEVPSDELRLHHDVAQISGAVRLDDGYAGGALEFPRQQWTNADVPVGDLVVWPSLVTHPHRGAPVTRGVKHGLTLWFRLPE